LLFFFYVQVPVEDRSKVNLEMQSVLKNVALSTANHQSIKNNSTRSPTRSAAAAAEAAEAANLVNVHESIDLDEVKVSIDKNNQEVNREEMELKRRADALEMDMKKLKERKLKLHLARYEHELRSASKEQLNKIIISSKKDMNRKIQSLKETTKKQLDAMIHFEHDLAEKIKRLMNVG
jgi:hypothetical protein